MNNEQSKYPVFGTLTAENVIDNYDCVTSDLETPQRWGKALRYVVRTKNQSVTVHDAVELIETETKKETKSRLLPLIIVSLLLYYSHYLKLYRQKMMFTSLILFLDDAEWRENIQGALGEQQLNAIMENAFDVLEDILSFYYPGTALLEELSARAQTPLMRDYLQGKMNDLRL